MEGEVAECRTRLTSLVASADQRSTVRMKYEVSMSLSEVKVSLVLHCLSSMIGNEVQAASGGKTDFMSISLCVLASFTISLIQGGGVMGRLSCTVRSVSDGCLDGIGGPSIPTFSICAASIALTDLVSKSAHASPNRLLNDVQTANLVRWLFLPRT